ncbi:MAG TPA: gliding motility-associated C-terminal domain-containing protein [Saprospiraceae bacterium]|nr:gliding motility-associated C-terminal domain-containing protein [Saprospiraceae bacterium]
MQYRRIIIFLCLVFSLVEVKAQLSFLSKIDSFPGEAAEMIPLPEGFLFFSGYPATVSDTVFSLTRFDKCGTLDWQRVFRTGTDQFNSFSKPEAILDRNNELFVLLSDLAEESKGYNLVKLDLNGAIIWSYYLHGVENSPRSKGNILYNNFRDTIVLTLNNEHGFTSVVRIDKDGSFIDQKEISGFRHHSSNMDNQGNIILLGDTAVVKLNSFLDLEWAKRLNGTSFFVQQNKPVIRATGHIHAVVVDTFGMDLDSFYYSMVSIDKNGDLQYSTDRIRGRDFGDIELLQTGTNNFVFLDRSLATTVDNLTRSIKKQTDYAFCEDTVAFCSSTMNLCMDNSLLFGGFYYDHPDSVTFYQGKTDPSLNLNCKEKNINPLDTIVASELTLDSIHFELNDYAFLQDTLVFQFIHFSPSGQEFPCFNAIVKKEDNEQKPCPCEVISVGVTWLKSAEYLWNTGATSNSIQVDTSGIYVVDVNLCGTEQRSTIKVDYKALTSCLSFADDSPLCPGIPTSLKVIHNYDNLLKTKWFDGTDNDSTSVFKAGQYLVDLEACGWKDQFVFDITYKSIEEEECIPVKIPNAFIPSSTTYEDNKVFKIYTQLDISAFKKFSMVIFDRWGEKVYETEDPFMGWDGTFRNSEMPPGAYLYNISYELDLGGEIYVESKNGQLLLVK